jgi:hypothetical protein
MYQWLVFVHLVGLVLFLLMHGVSMWAVFAVRRDPTPDAARLLLGLSSRANQTMYLGLLLLGIGGLGAAWNANLLTAGWVVASYVVLVVVLIGMWAMGAGFYYPLREALSPKDGSASTIDAAELAQRLDNRRPEGLAIVGLGGLVILVWLMTLKPF